MVSASLRVESAQSYDADMNVGLDHVVVVVQGLPASMRCFETGGFLVLRVAALLATAPMESAHPRASSPRT